MVAAMAPGSCRRRSGAQESQSFFTIPLKMECLENSADLPRWEEVATQKQQQDMQKIPLEWRLSQHIVDRARKQKNITNNFIDELLDDKTKHVTSLDAPILVERTGNGSLTALEVVIAFCKRAALAHQLVPTSISLPSAATT